MNGQVGIQPEAQTGEGIDSLRHRQDKDYISLSFRLRIIGYPSTPIRYG